MGNINAFYNLAYCYRNGIGTPRDLQKADYWYQKEQKELIEKYPIPWIPYNEFTDVEKIGQGGFATVFKAIWYNKEQFVYSNVALKLLHGSNPKKSQNEEFIQEKEGLIKEKEGLIKQKEEFIKELKAFCDIISKHPSFLRCCGISKDDSSGDYIIVLQYAAMGSLRKNLCSVAQMEWKHRLTLLHSIASDLQIIHSQGLIHRDLHSCNILQDDLKSAYITDLGLAISTNKAPEEKGNGIYGILPYIAPESSNIGYTAACYQGDNKTLLRGSYVTARAFNLIVGTGLLRQTPCNKIVIVRVRFIINKYLNRVKRVTRAPGWTHRSTRVTRVAFCLTEFLKKLLRCIITCEEEILKGIFIKLLRCIITCEEEILEGIFIKLLIKNSKINV
ncbi:kinase-like domain-containing protein [Gigaspora rosea]|uniref:Kinase-like domain-containing protein n=1 Tax=Gigaspora rosea TaxID=44941 RepID=A0A397UPP0_9GLOM|nr:kinase-like domain-containing protein [Gigaspora rosea]